MTQTTPFREFEVVCFYHTEESGKMKIIARNASDAEEIARMQFPKTYTDKCKLDTIEVML